MMLDNIPFVVAILLLIPGIFMAFVPMLPALSYMFVVSLLFGLYERFATLSVWNVLLLLCITLLSIIVDHTAGVLGAKYTGAHIRSLLWGIAGSFVGLFIFPAFGSFIGLFIAVLVAEFYYKNHHVQAFKAASGALLGSIAGVAVNVILSVAFIVSFAILALR